MGETVPTCTGCVTCIGCTDNIITSELTSGYYSGEDRVKPNSSKCSHGGPLDFSVLSGGINKDSSLCTRAPHFFLHFQAAAVAKEATKQYLRSIKDAVTAKQIKLLLGVGPSLTISMDTTGSMGSIINGVKQQAIQIVNSRLGTDEEPSQYVLAPFNDPFIGPLTVTDDADTFKAAISSLFASGGGDCPELAMGGLLQGLSASDEGGVLFMFTDASISNTAVMTSTTSDPNSTNNQATATVAASNPAPAILDASVSESVLWPPNHKMVDVTVNYTIADNCGAVTTALSVMSNEPVNGGNDGNTSADWIVVDAHHVQLRAERAGGGSGRVYTINITSTDSAGNSSSSTVFVTVPNNR